MRRWQRPYALDAATGFAVLGLVGVVGFATFFVITPVHERMPTPLAILFGMWLAVVAAVAARQAMLGVYVSDRGVRSRSLLRTATVPWASVADIRSGAATIAGLDMGRATIVIERTDGESVQTPLQRGDLFRPFTFRPELGRLATWPEHYDEILATLQAHLREAQRRGQAPVTDRPAQPPAAGARPTIRSAGVHRTRTPSGGPTVDKRRDIHALTRQHQRGALTDAEFAAELAKIHERD
ncbi:PH domain-containing protein [Micromonospora coriariae]|uniref:PH domain-containing protein n=1 Tax=Micromonospora coriariae TaxID=285665 RepID=A0A1C4WQP0_9ACTN|nr:PH domain-containing protein [Micromonospora coriariae]SCE98504.1 PH domain-containing protein [Micromonospora coriariae]